MEADSLATFVGTGLALLGLGFGVGAGWERSLRRPRVDRNPKSQPAHVLSQINLEFARPELRRLDVVGYSVHSMYDRIQGLISHALGSRIPVRILLLNSDSVGLTEKAFLEHRATTLDMTAFRERSRTSIRRTAERISDGAEIARYQANLGSVDCKVRVYNALPVYRAVITNLGTVSSSYLDDLALPSRDFPMDGPGANPVAEVEGKRADQWFNYLWQFRSRPVGTEAVLFDLYDTIVRVDPQARRRHRDSVAKKIGVGADEFSGSWRTTKAASNTGQFPTTAHRFVEVLALLGLADLAPELARELAAAEHKFLLENVRVNSVIPHLFTELRERGYKTGVVSNCSPSVLTWFAHSGLMGLVNSATFSFEVGAAKPDPKIYEAAAAELDVDVAACTFVGDGEDDELSGASESGMAAVRAAWYADNTQFNAPQVAHSVRDVAQLIDAEALWQL